MMFWAIKGPPWDSEKGPGWSNMTYDHVIYPWEVFYGHLVHLGSCGAVLSHYSDFEPFYAILVMFCAILGPT